VLEVELRPRLADAGSLSHELNRNFLLELENDTIVCPSCLIATSRNEFLSKHSRRSAIHTGTARIAPFCARFLQYSPSPCPLVRPISAANSTTLISLSGRYREGQCTGVMQHALVCLSAISESWQTVV